jgi:geranylgeranyl reductase family protein
MIDVLVIGLGPAGAAAARSAASAGASVLAVDRRSRVGEPVQCAEFVPAPLRQDVASLDRVLRQAIGRMRTQVEGEGRHETPDFRGCMIDRALFDAQLVAAAQAAGAACRFATAVRRLECDGSALLANGQVVRARAIIGADGPRSLVGAAIGCGNRELVETRQMRVRLTRAHDATDVFLTADLQGGYGWLFPSGDQANLGVGAAFAKRAQLKPVLERLHAQLIAEGAVGREILNHTGGPIPVGGMVGPIGALGAALVLLAGDAAGLANPVTGAGIAAAVQSGTLAGAAAARATEAACADYCDDLADLFAASLGRALARRTELLAAHARARPAASALRRGWIAYPEYWAA